MADLPTPDTLPPGRMPRHVAIVMDGNGRWAQKRFLPRVAGHKQGVEALSRTVQACMDRRIDRKSVVEWKSLYHVWGRNN